MTELTLASKRKRPPREAANPTIERLRHTGGDYEVGDDQQGRITVTMRDSPFERLLLQKTITKEQYHAGSRYRSHWYHAGLAGNPGTVDLDRIHGVDAAGYGGMPKTEAQAFHRGEFRRAVQAIGITNSWVLDWVVCRDIPLEDTGYMLGWELRSEAIAAATERLRFALEELCKLWGM